MPQVTATLSQQFKLRLMQKQIDLANDTIYVCLVRQNFQFNANRYGIRNNMRTNSGAISLTFTASNQRITRSSGSFITDGFVIGNRITTDSSNNPGPFIITDVAASYIQVASGIVNEGPVTKTVYSDDELASGNGYTQYNKTLGNKSVQRNDTNGYAEMTCDNVSWLANGGTIGPTPGALLIDDSTSEKTIIGYLDFGGDQEAPNGFYLSIGGIRVRVA